LRRGVSRGNLELVSTLLQDFTAREAARCELERQRLLAALRAALEELLPRGEVVWIHGSLTQPGRFGDHSDVDLALERRPPAFSEYWLQGELELRLGRAVDVVLLPETRLREKIEREGLRWTL
jgi:predicted nucleotidyltransferase